MDPSISAQLTAQFYNWETRHRGWNSYAFPVDIEPNFVPFFYHHPKQNTAVDDGRRHSFFTKFFRSDPVMEQPEMEEEEPYYPIAYPKDDPELYGIRLTIPKQEKSSSEMMKHLLLMLSETQYPVSFEITATNTVIYFQIVCRVPDRRSIESQFRAYHPGVILSDCTDSINNIISEESDVCCMDFGLENEFMCPLSEMGSIDPYVALFGVLDHLEPSQKATLQILFKGACNPWTGSIMRSVMSNDGGHFFVNDPDMVPSAWDKVDSPLFGVVIRAIGLGETFDDSVRICSEMGKALIRSTASKENNLIQLRVYDRDDFINDVALRQSHRMGMLLNSEELAALIHLPSSAVLSKKIERERRLTKALPDCAKGFEFILGTNIHHGVTHQASISSSGRTRHIHIIGATGTGKSVFLRNCIMQDMQQGNGLILLDPHGDLVETVLANVPGDRVKDVILIDPSDAEHPIGFNVLSAHTEIEKELLSSDLIAIFKRMSTSWGDQMHSVLANAIIAMLDAKQGATLLDLRRFLLEKQFRTKFLQSLQDPSIRYYWEKEYPLLKSSSIGSILTRLDSFLRPKLIRNMVAQKAGPDFEQIMDSKKILLIKLPIGIIGEENSYLLGSFIMSKISLAAFARQAKSKEDRKDFYVYADEFQHFTTASMSSMLSGSRKYGVSLILAHQDMQQVSKRDPELAESLATNPGTRVCFRLGDTDAKRFANTLSTFEATDLQNLGIGEAIVRMEKNEQDFTVSISQIPESGSDNAEQIIRDIIDYSRKAYGKPKSTVETLLRELYSDIETTYGPKEAEPDTKGRKAPVLAPDPLPVYETTATPLTSLPIVEVAKAEKTKPDPSQHRYLQTLIKKMAESRGYRVSIEEQTPDKKGRVDVSLEGNGRRIACEVSVTSTDIYEVHNIEKCLAAGYDTVVSCSTDKKILDKIRKAIEQNISQKEIKKIIVVTPDELFQYLDMQVAKDASGEKLIKGYRVKVEYDPVSESDMEKKKEAISNAIRNSIRNRNSNKGEE